MKHLHIQKQIKAIMEALDKQDPDLTYYLNEHFRSYKVVLGPWERVKEKGPRQSHRVRRSMQGSPIARIIPAKQSEHLFTGWTHYFEAERFETPACTTWEHAAKLVDTHLLGLGIRLVDPPGPWLEPWFDIGDDNWVRMSEKQVVARLVPIADSKPKKWALHIPEMDYFPTAGVILDLAKRNADLVLKRFGYSYEKVGFTPDPPA